MKPEYNESNIPSVSGGKDNNPDKLLVITIAGLTDTSASDLLSQYCPQGFWVAGFSDGRVILSNYEKDKK